MFITTQFSHNIGVRAEAVEEAPLGRVVVGDALVERLVVVDHHEVARPPKVRRRPRRARAREPEAERDGVAPRHRRVNDDRGAPRRPASRTDLNMTPRAKFWS